MQYTSSLSVSTTLSSSDTSSSRSAGAGELLRAGVPACSLLVEAFIALGASDFFFLEGALFAVPFLVAPIFLRGGAFFGADSREGFCSDDFFVARRPCSFNIASTAAWVVESSTLLEVVVFMAISSGVTGSSFLTNGDDSLGVGDFFALTLVA